MNIEPETIKHAAELRENRIRMRISEHPIGAGTFYLAGEPEIVFIDDDCEWTVWNACRNFTAQELRDLSVVALRAAAKIDELNSTRFLQEQSHG